MPKVNFNPQGTLIQDEALFVPPQSHITGTKFKLAHDIFSSVDFSITYNGEALVPQVDYVLTDVYERARQEMGLTVYQRVQFLPNAPLGFTSTVYVTYRAVGDFVDADNYMNIDDGDDRYCKKINNLSDVNADSAILNLIQSASSIRDDAVRDDTEIPCFTGSAYAQGSYFGKVSLLKIFNNWLKSKFQSWLGITVTESGGSITGRSFDGNAARTSNAITFSNSGDGAASGSTFDGSAARKLSYNSIGAAAARDVYAFTYIVDSPQKLDDWSNNVAGNDYTSVLIKKGSYNINNTTTDKRNIISLHQTGTLLVMFEKGAKIIASDNVRVANSFNYVFAFNPDTFPTNINEYPVIYNANVEFSSAGVGVGFSSHCINHNCQCVLTSINTTGFFGVCAFDGTHAEAIHCTAESGSNYQRQYLARFAKKVIDCYSSTMGIDSAVRVRDCICKGYHNSYSSPNADPTYACANTLNGGWNTTL